MAMWHSLTHNWNVARIMRLVLGGMILYQGFLTNQTGVMLMGGFFTLFSLFTSGCCGTVCNSNQVNNENKNTNKNELITYEEVK